MRIVKNKILPPRGFKAINLFGVIFTRRCPTLISEQTKRHEVIHTAQMREMLFIPFYIWYVLEWLFRLIQYRNRMEAYRNISFEREAFANDRNENYLNERRRYSFFKYLKNGK